VFSFSSLLGIPTGAARHLESRAGGTGGGGRMRESERDLGVGVSPQEKAFVRMGLLQADYQLASLKKLSVTR
jgi:hypothetical protein